MVQTTHSGEAFSGESLRTIDVLGQPEIVLDSGFLFSAEFVRLGDDLLLRGADGTEVLLRDYFTQIPPPQLETAEGARLAPDTVEDLAGPAFPLSFAQAGDTPLSAPIGEVSSLHGIARVQRADGARDDLHEGDPIFLGDVVSTGVGSDLGIVFVDDTVFSLSANARMVVDELIYNPSGASNVMGVSLIQGTFVFVTGNIAPSGEMNVETPAGTIGIRGTTVGVRIGTFGGVTRIVNIENPETGEVGRFTFSNFGGSAQFTQANHFLEVRSADIVLGQATAEAVGKRATYVELDLIRVKGKREPQRIFALLGGPELAEDAEVRDTIRIMDDLLTAYRFQAWDATAQAVDALAGRRLAHVDLEIFRQLYRRRIGRFSSEPPPPGWDGVHSVETK